MKALHLVIHLRDDHALDLMTGGSHFPMRWQLERIHDWAHQLHGSGHAHDGGGR